MPERKLYLAPTDLELAQHDFDYFLLRARTELPNPDDRTIHALGMAALRVNLEEEK